MQQYIIPTSKIKCKRISKLIDKAQVSGAIKSQIHSMKLGHLPTLITDQQSAHKIRLRSRKRCFFYTKAHFTRTQHSTRTNYFLHYLFKSTGFFVYFFKAARFFLFSRCKTSEFLFFYSWFGWMRNGRSRLAGRGLVDRRVRLPSPGRRLNEGQRRWRHLQYLIDRVTQIISAGIAGFEKNAFRLIYETSSYLLG